MSAPSSASSGAPAPKGRWSSVKRLLQVAAYTALWVAALFGASGRLSWTRGWTFLALYVATMAAAAIVIRRYNPTLMEARTAWARKDTKFFDKVLTAIYTPLTFIQPAVAGLDARFGWSSMPFATVYWGAALFVPAAVLITWTLAVNRFAETTVRIQTERGHTVISSGPYRIVRHPMYVGMSLLFVAAALILGSVWAMAVTGLMTVLLIVRTALEDRTLRRELPGYEAYTAQTRYRLFPGIW